MCVLKLSQLRQHLFHHFLANHIVIVEYGRVLVEISSCTACVNIYTLLALANACLDQCILHDFLKVIVRNNL